MSWQQAAQAVNTLLVQTYWHIGLHIVEFEQGGKEKADYGCGMLSHKLIWSRNDDQESGGGGAP